MSALNIEYSDLSSGGFWDKLHTLIPELVRCRFFCTAMGVANGRLREFNRESGPFLPAIRKSHLPCAIHRLDNLKKAAEGLRSFTADNDDFRLEGDPLKPVIDFIARFENELVCPLDEVQKRDDETEAGHVIDSLKSKAANLAQSAKEIFTQLLSSIGPQVTNCIVRRNPQESHFISCVSLDLAQYGRHIKILNNYAEAAGVFALNRRIQNFIQASINAASGVLSTNRERGFLTGGESPIDACRNRELL